MDDRDVVAVQIGRPPRSRVDVAARCHLGLPVVVEVPPLLDDGTPFPTRYWLSCPLAVRRVGRLEAAGGVKAAEETLLSNEAMAERQRVAMERYRKDRDRLIPAGHRGPVPSGGVGGARRGVKCLHAHLADDLAGNDNPVGQMTVPDVLPLDCTLPCVIDVGGEAQHNPDWIEPRP